MTGAGSLTKTWGIGSENFAMIALGNGGGAGDAELRRSERLGAWSVVDWMSEIQTAVNDAAWYHDRQQRNVDTRLCFWDGQSEDGRKRQAAMGVEPFPWEGASDTRIRLADEIVRDRVRVMKAAARSARVRVNAIGAEDQARAGRVLQTLRWMLDTQIAEEVRREGEFFRNWRETHGSAVMRIVWREEVAYEVERISLEGLATRIAELLEGAAEEEGGAADAQAWLAEAWDVVQSTAREEELVRYVVQLYPGVARRAVRAAVRALHRGDPEVELPVPTVIASRPQWRAGKVMEDVFFPVNTHDLNVARFVAWRELLSETEVMERADAEDWKEGWAERAIERKGQSFLGESWQRRRAIRGIVSERTYDDVRDMVEVWTVYFRAHDDRGVPGIYCTVFSPSVPDEPAKEDELVPYAHGRYPFVIGRTEHVERPIVESRGVPEVVMTWQWEKKVQRDARADAAALNTLPPIEAPTGLSKQRIWFGPGTINYTRNPGSLRFMQVPQFAAASVEVEAALERDINEYFGRARDGVSSAKVLQCMQELVDDHLAEYGAMLRMTLQLMQQYLPETSVIRVTNQAPEVVRVSAEEIRGQFDLTVKFDARDMDPEALEAKLALLNTAVLPADVAGVIDRAALTRWQMYAIDASLADEIVRDDAAVTQAEVEDEQVQLAKIYSGQEPPHKEQGQNAALRLQVIDNTIAANPQLQARYRDDEIYRNLIDNRRRAFQFRLQQMQNAQIGRVGVSPVLGQQ